MKKLILMRHGHAHPLTGNSTDKARNLDRKGIEQVSVIAKKMIAAGILPDYIISSNAERAMESAAIIKDASEFEGEVVREERLYSASPEIYTQILTSIPDIYSSVLIIAHNPVMEEVVSELLAKHIGVGTANLFSAEIKIDSWRDFKLSGNIVTSKQFILPESSE